LNFLNFRSTENDAMLMAFDRQPEKMLDDKKIGNCFGFDVSFKNISHLFDYPSKIRSFPSIPGRRGSRFGRGEAAQGFD
jgi:hypothetical protein